MIRVLDENAPITPRVAAGSDDSHNDNATRLFAQHVKGGGPDAVA
jgi:hypothetical protein